jgi:hypothetical protein
MNHLRRNQRKLTDMDRVKIRIRHRVLGETSRALAAEYGVTQRTIFRCNYPTEFSGRTDAFSIAGVRARERADIDGPAFFWRGFWRPL